MQANTGWYWTPALGNGRCDECGNAYAKTMVIAWNSTLRAKACGVCGERYNPQPSKRLRVATRKAATEVNGRQVKSRTHKKRDAEARKRYDKRARKKSGPVIVRFECPKCGGGHRASECDVSC